MIRENETVKIEVFASHGAKMGRLVLTDQRLMFLAHSFMRLVGVGVLGMIPGIVFAGLLFWIPFIGPLIGLTVGVMLTVKILMVDKRPKTIVSELDLQDVDVHTSPKGLSVNAKGQDPVEYDVKDSNASSLMNAFKELTD